MRKEGSFTYDEDTEIIILKQVLKNQILTTTAVHRELKNKFFNKIHKMTVKRILETMKSKGLVKCRKIGRYYLWSE